MTIPAPNRIIWSVQNPETEPLLNRYVYICGNPNDTKNRIELELMVPLNAGDYIHVALPGEDKPIRRRVDSVEFHELDMKGLGDLMYTPCLTLSEHE